MELIASAIEKLARALIRFIIVAYQATISPLLGRHCRFYPSCSQYALVAIDRHGVLKGLFLGVCRLMRCNGFFPGGYDPVPDDVTIAHTSSSGAQINVFPKG